MYAISGCMLLEKHLKFNNQIAFFQTVLEGLFINKMLLVVEAGFKNPDVIVKKQAYISWCRLMDNFALNPGEFENVR